MSLSGLGLPVDDIFGSITGKDAADAAEAGAASQERLGREGIQQQERFFNQLMQSLAPFMEFGAGNIDQLQSQLGSNPFMDRFEQLSNPGQQLDFVNNNPFFGGLRDQAVNSLFNNQAARGKVGSGGTAEALQQSFLNLGTGLVDRELGNLTQGSNMRQSGINNLFNSVNLGQNAAAGVGQAGQQTGNQISNLLTGIGNSQAAGGIGAANARQQGFNNLLNLGGSALALSDRRFKTNIKRLADIVGKFVYPTYEYTYIGDDHKVMGVMAQDVEKVNPDAVVTFYGVKYVDYGLL
jgi:hypothetical protein